MQVNAALMQDALKQVNEVITREIGKVKGMFVTKTAFDKFSSGTVDALEQERARIIKSEKLTHDVLKKYKSRSELNLKQLDLKLEAKINTLLRGEVQDKFDVFIDAFDSKLRKLNHKIDKIAETSESRE